MTNQQDKFKPHVLAGFNVDAVREGKMDTVSIDQVVELYGQTAVKDLFSDSLDKDQVTFMVDKETQDPGGQRAGRGSLVDLLRLVA